MESIKLLIKGIYTVLLMLLKYILSILQQFLKWLISIFRKVLRWFLLPSVRPWLIGFTFLLLTYIIGSYRYYTPEVAMTFSDPLKSNNIYTSNFTIENNGYSNIYNFKLEHENRNVKLNNNINFGRMVYPNSMRKYKRIAKKKKQDVKYNFFESGNAVKINNGDYITESAEIIMFVEFEYWKNPFFKPRIAKDTFSFKTSDLIDGKIVWLYNQ